MNVKEIKKEIKAMGLSARRIDGEWRINFKNGREETAYYTTDNADALATAKAMSKQK